MNTTTKTQHIDLTERLRWRNASLCTTAESRQTQPPQSFSEEDRTKQPSERTSKKYFSFKFSKTLASCSASRIDSAPSWNTGASELRKFVSAAPTEAETKWERNEKGRSTYQQTAERNASRSPEKEQLNIKIYDYFVVSPLANSTKSTARPESCSISAKTAAQSADPTPWYQQ